MSKQEPLLRMIMIGSFGMLFGYSTHRVIVGVLMQSGFELNRASLVADTSLFIISLLGILVSYFILSTRRK